MIVGVQWRCGIHEEFIFFLLYNVARLYGCCYVMLVQFVDIYYEIIYKAIVSEFNVFV